MMCVALNKATNFLDYRQQLGSLQFPMYMKPFETALAPIIISLLLLLL
mgnify:CR=1 FL=1